MINPSLVNFCAHEIARDYLEEGYATMAKDQGWDPMRFDLMPGDLDFLRGEHGDDLSMRAGRVPDDEREAFEDAVLREVRTQLSDAVAAL